MKDRLMEKAELEYERFTRARDEGDKEESKAAGEAFLDAISAIESAGPEAGLLSPFQIGEHLANTAQDSAWRQSKKSEVERYLGALGK